MPVYNSACESTKKALPGFITTKKPLTIKSGFGQKCSGPKAKMRAVQYCNTILGSSAHSGGL